MYVAGFLQNHLSVSKIHPLKYKWVVITWKRSVFLRMSRRCFKKINKQVCSEPWCSFSETGYKFLYY